MRIEKAFERQASDIQKERWLRFDYDSFMTVIDRNKAKIWFATENVLTLLMGRLGNSPNRDVLSRPRIADMKPRQTLEVEA